MKFAGIGENELLKIRPHLFFWTVFICFETAIIYFMEHSFAHFTDYLTHYLLNIGLFYCNAYLVLRFAYNTPNFLGKAVLLGTLVLLIYLGLKYLLHLLNISSGIHTTAQLGTVHYFFHAGIWRVLFLLGLSTAYVFSVSALLHRKQVANLQLQQLQNELYQQKLEKDLLTTEIAFLKAQINPHFVFNSLNFIQNYVADYSEKGSEMIIQLSEVVRYTFTEPAADGKVNLDTELEHLHSYLYLNQQRFNQQLHLNLQVNGNTQNIRVIPLVLISILENIFKYGLLTDSNHPAKFHLNANAKWVSLFVQNQKAKRNHVSSSGIGMSNIQKRLNQHYPGQYSLNVKQNEYHYELNLNIAIPAYDLLYY